MKRILLFLAIIAAVAVIAASIIALNFYNAPAILQNLCSPNGSLLTQTSTEKNNLLSRFGVSCLRVQDSNGNSVLDGWVYVATGQAELEQGFQNVTGFGDCNGFAVQANSCYGMIFVFPTTQDLCFWMHNTIMPLRQSWISENGTVTAIYTASPETDTTVCHSAKYVLESAPSSPIIPGDRIVLNSNET